MRPPTTYIAVTVDTRLTGIVARHDNTLLGHTLIPFQDNEDGWLRTVLDTVRHYDNQRPSSELVVLVLSELPGVAPYGANGVGYGVVLHALLTGAAHGAGAGMPLLVVQAAAYGSWLHAGYPAELVGARERQGSHGRLGLCRAAWDMAGAAMPAGPPTAPAERAALRELVTVHGPGRPGGDRDDLVVACQVCGHQMHRLLRGELVDWEQVKAEMHAADQAGQPWTGPSATEREHAALQAASAGDLAAAAERVLADFVRRHPAQHLYNAGRDGSRLISGGGGR